MTRWSPIAIKPVRSDEGSKKLTVELTGRDTVPQRRHCSRSRQRKPKRSTLRASSNASKQNKKRETEPLRSFSLSQQQMVKDVDHGICLADLPTFRATFDFRYSVPRTALLSSEFEMVKRDGVFIVGDLKSFHKKTTPLPAEILHIIFEQLFEFNEMSSHGKFAAFGNAYRVCSTWRNIILRKTFRSYYQLRKGQWQYDEFRFSPWEGSFVYRPSWHLYHRPDYKQYGRRLVSQHDGIDEREPDAVAQMQNCKTSETRVIVTT